MVLKMLKQCSDPGAEDEGSAGHLRGSQRRIGRCGTEDGERTEETTRAGY